MNGSQINMSFPSPALSNLRNPKGTLQTAKKLLGSIKEDILKEVSRISLTLPKSVEHNSFVPMITAEQKLTPPAAVYSAFFCKKKFMYLVPKQTTLDALTNRSGRGNIAKALILDLSFHNSSVPQLKPFLSYFSSKENCAHSSLGELNRNKI